MLGLRVDVFGPGARREGDQAETLENELLAVLKVGVLPTQRCPATDVMVRRAPRRHQATSL
jgi:hypothetical protein